jgi:hypothetical protein
VHAPLAVRTLLEGTTRYIRNHLREELFGRPVFDVVSAFWYRDAAAAAGVLRRTATPAGEAIARDELTFMNKPVNTFFAVSEHPVRGAEADPAAFAAIALVRRPAGEDVAAFHADFEAKQVPALLDAASGSTWCLHHRALRNGPAEPAFDAVTQVHAARDAGLVDWAGRLTASGAGVVLVTVTEHESVMPDYESEKPS